ncbi:MAG TPA: GNAT family N-acetyltransferase [Vicinamibacterales bacterium]
MASYAIRCAGESDVAVICDHRRRMFDDLGRPMDTAAIVAFETWLADALTSGLYHGWLAQTPDGEVAGGAGLTVLPWPPGPHDPTGRLAFVYNVFTYPNHRRLGLARMLMTAIHDWCRQERIRTVRLHASPEGRPLYESLGYLTTNEMMLALDGGSSPASKSQSR